MTVVTVVTKQFCTPKNQTYLKPSYLPTYVTVVTVGTVVTVVKVVPKKNFARKKFLSENIFFTKKPLHTKNHATSSHLKSRNLFTLQFTQFLNKKSMQPLRRTNHAPYRKIKHATWVSEWEKALNFSTHKNHATSPHKKSRNLSRNKHCQNRKMLPWEHHIGCQMCQIAFSKSTEVACFLVERLCELSHYYHCCQYWTNLSQYFWKQQFYTFDNQCDVLRAAFCDSHDVFTWLAKMARCAYMYSMTFEWLKKPLLSKIQWFFRLP